MLAADRLLGNLVRKIEYATEETERIVKKPIREAHALNVGVRPWIFIFRRQNREQTDEMYNTVRPSFLNFKSFEDATDRLPVKTETHSKPILP